jgi:hypothetical protein
MTPLYLSLVASVLQGTPVLEESSPLVREAPGADGTSLGPVSVEVDGTSTWLGGDAGGLLQDWVMCSTSIGAPGSATLGDATPVPKSSGAVGTGAPGLLLPGSPSFLLPPIDWRQM